jgi:hypothetical protein
MLEIIYNDAKDQYVANFVAYGKAADSKLYYDAEYTTQVKKADAEDAFMKGRLLIKTASGVVAATGIAGAKVLTVAMSGSPAALTGTEWAVATA